MGPHRYRIDEDVLFWCPSGEVTAEHASQVCKLFSQQADRFGYVLWLVDAAASVPVGNGARRVYAAWMEASTRPLYVAPFRSPVPAFTMASLVLRGVQLRGGALVYSQHSDTEEQARAYLDRMRGQQQAPLPVERAG